MKKMMLFRNIKFEGNNIVVKLSNRTHGYYQTVIIEPRAGSNEIYIRDISNILARHTDEVVRDKAKPLFHYIRNWYIENKMKQPHTPVQAPITSGTVIFNLDPATGMPSNNPPIDILPLAEEKPKSILPEKTFDIHIPNKVADYMMPDQSRSVLSSIRRGKNVLLVGPSGCGKSRLIVELAKLEGANLERINLNGGVTDASLVGEKGLRVTDTGTETFFQYGVLPTAMKKGSWLLLDELDFCQPEYLAVLQAVFEGNGTPLVIMDNGGERIVPHEDFRIIACANTLGRGDTGGYHGTNALNIATLDRWAIVTMDYTEKEARVLKEILESDELISKMMSLTKRVRESIKQQQLPDMVFSTRRLIHLAEALKDPNMSFKEAIEMELLGRTTNEERAIIFEYVKDIFGKEYFTEAN